MQLQIGCHCVRILHAFQLVSLVNHVLIIVFSQSSFALGFHQLSGFIATRYDFRLCHILLRRFILHFPAVNEVFFGKYETLDYFDPVTELFFPSLFFGHTAKNK